jgi:hypothetical protein
VPKTRATGIQVIKYGEIVRRFNVMALDLRCLEEVNWFVLFARCISRTNFPAYADHIWVADIYITRTKSTIHELLDLYAIRTTDDDCAIPQCVKVRVLFLGIIRFIRRRIVQIENYGVCG